MTTPNTKPSGQSVLSPISRPVSWRLKSGFDRRLKQGHPWVYSNELQTSPKGVEPGALVELCDAGGAFLAWGYGNPHSLISFRVLSRDPEGLKNGIAPWLKTTLAECWEFRAQLGLAKSSFRLVHGEGDLIPGLIIDAYLLESGERVLVVQAHTAGVDRMIGTLQEVLPALIAEKKEKLGALVIRRDLSVRKLEGIEIAAEAEVVGLASGLDLKTARILVRGAGTEKSSMGANVAFDCDLEKGQKTGFFLDQSENIRQVASLVSPLMQSVSGRPIRILDLCCHLGQWSAKLAQVLIKNGLTVECTLVDSSKTALALAKINVERTGAKAILHAGDVLEDLKGLESRHYDIVISDPPAFIQGRKEIPQGTHAYVKLNTETMRLVREGGAAVCCSCSQLLEDEEFARVLVKAARRSGRSARFIARGTQALDHPMRLEFTEGRYLKMHLGIVR